MGQFLMPSLGADMEAGSGSIGEVSIGVCATVPSALDGIGPGSVTEPCPEFLVFEERHPRLSHLFYGPEWV